MELIHYRYSTVILVTRVRFTPLITPLQVFRSVLLGLGPDVGTLVQLNTLLQVCTKSLF